MAATHDLVEKFARVSASAELERVLLRCSRRAGEPRLHACAVSYRLCLVLRSVLLSSYVLAVSPRSLVEVGEFMTVLEQPSDEAELRSVFLNLARHILRSPASA